MEYDEPILEKCERCGFQASRPEQVQEIEFHGYELKLCENCYNAARASGEIH